MLRLFLVVPLTNPVVTPRRDKVNLEIPLPQRLLEIPEGWDGSIYVFFFKGKDPVFLTNHHYVKYMK